jgi:hypothetical protein
MKTFHLFCLSLLVCGIVFNILNVDSLSYSQEQKGVIAGLFLENAEPCSLQINLHRWDNKLYFGNTVSGKNGYYAFTDLPFGSYYLITHPVTAMPLQWLSEKVEITSESPVYIMPTIDGWSVKILYPTDGTQIEPKKISKKNPLVFRWTPYNGLAEYEVEIFSTDQSQAFKSGRIADTSYAFTGRFKDNSTLQKRLYRWLLKVYPTGTNWSGTSNTQDLFIRDLGEIKTYEGKYIKLEFPKWYEPTLNKLDLVKKLDKCYQLEKELAAGQVPFNGEKQAFLYDPKIRFAHSGNPIHFGKNLFKEWDFPFNISFHEMAHNFQYDGLPRFHYLLGGEYYSKTALYNGFAEGLATLANLYITETLEEKDVLPQTHALIIRDKEKMRKDFPEALRVYEESGANSERITPDIVDGMLIRLGDEYGWDMYPKFFRIFLKNETTDQIYKLAGTDDTKRVTILVAAFCLACGDDLRDQFKKWDFPIDDDYFETIRPMVKSCIHKN